MKEKKGGKIGLLAALLILLVGGLLGIDTSGLLKSADAESASGYSAEAGQASKKKGNVTSPVSRNTDGSFLQVHYMDVGQAMRR